MRLAFPGLTMGEGGKRFSCLLLRFNSLKGGGGKKEKGKAVQLPAILFAWKGGGTGRFLLPLSLP